MFAGSKPENHTSYLRKPASPPGDCQTRTGRRNPGRDRAGLGGQGHLGFWVSRPCRPLSFWPSFTNVYSKGASDAHALSLTTSERWRDIDNRWMGTGESGESFQNASHPYSRDLDLFGAGSLFELLCTARTQAGQETLAKWLLAPAPPQLGPCPPRGRGRFAEPVGFARRPCGAGGGGAFA